MVVYTGHTQKWTTSFIYRRREREQRLVEKRRTAGYRQERQEFVECG
ncbi:hypothetical protein [Cylindrospermum sp. FACHB-282]|nr:hypothetical protein [Cylindrospermum sp. FACHB-282]MBD2388686.1 hypothetical protein [Cylindrospermum sp. FACHB-282]